VIRYNAEGLDGLVDRPGRGRPCRLTAPQLEQLRQRIDAGPTPEDGTCTLRGPEVRALLGREFGVAYSPAAVYSLLHRLGYEPLDPRPRHIKADPAAQEEFKKKSPTGSATSPALTPTSGSRSGSRTRRGSARRGR
jgi:transposase